jgi:hypothetical protein
MAIVHSVFRLGIGHRPRLLLPKQCIALKTGLAPGEELAKTKTWSWISNVKDGKKYVHGERERYEARGGGCGRLRDGEDEKQHPKDATRQSYERRN